ncbi:hypothetical protein IDH29_01450 [Pelagibacterales bacterium SAG-MED06]|nr:hypothetical protein [Pelagibacterales bacterium SAG-MED06]
MKKNYNWSHDKVLERFEFIEKKLNLDKSLISQVPWWDMLRYKLFKEILFDLRLREKKNDEKKIRSKKKIIKISKIRDYIFDFFKLFSKNSPFWIKKKSNIILGHPRRKLEKNIYVDPYSDPFIDLFPSSFNFSIIERKDINNKHLSPTKTKNIFYSDILNRFGSLFSKFQRVKLEEFDNLIISKLENSLYNEFSIKIEIKPKLIKMIKKWLGTNIVMSLFFKIKKPKLLIIVVSAGQEAIISAAKSLKITTLELQHGTPSRGKLNYDYSSGIEKKSFPEYFLSFGDFWPLDCKLPIKKTNIIPFGFPYLFNKKTKYSNIKKENRLVIVSQSDFTDQLSKFAIKTSKLFSTDIKVEYKPHPYEYVGSEPKYFQELRNAGVTVSDKGSDIYEIFARSRWQVGIFSTALYEGLYFNVACFVLDISGSEHMKKIIELDIARLISSPEQIDLSLKVNKNKIEKIFSYPNQKNIDYIISLAK